MYRHKEQGDIMSLLSCFQNEESALKILETKQHSFVNKYHNCKHVRTQKYGAG
jgi:hypothetical protein